MRRGQPPPCLPVNRVKSGRPMLTAPPGRVRVSPAASTFATLPLLNLSHLLHTSRHQLRRRFSSSLETILNCCFRCLWLNYPATMSPTRHALAEVVPNVNRAPAPTQTKPSRPRQGWPATFQDKENVNIIPSCSPPHRHRHRHRHGRTFPGHRPPLPPARSWPHPPIHPYPRWEYPRSRLWPQNWHFPPGSRRDACQCTTHPIPLKRIPTISCVSGGALRYSTPSSSHPSSTKWSASGRLSILLIQPIAPAHSADFIHNASWQHLPTRPEWPQTNSTQLW